MTSTQVNRPTDVKQKEVDINQKLQLYGIFNGESSYASAVEQSVLQDCASRSGVAYPCWHLKLTSSPQQLLRTAKYHQ